MFLIRLMFWLGFAVLLLPADERQQARLYDTAAAAVERMTSFCDRNARTCATGAELWAAFVKKAEFGARMAFDLMSSRRDGEAAQRPAPQPIGARGTLTPSDLAPAWRGATRS